MNWKKCCRIFWQAVLLITGGVLLVILAALLYLGIYGIPRHYSDRLAEQLSSTNYTVTVHSIGFRFSQGIVVHGLRVVDNENPARPLVAAKRAALFVNPFGWLRDRAGMGKAAGTEQTSLARSLEGLRGRLTLAKTDAAGVWIEKGFAGVIIHDGVVKVEPVNMILGEGQARSTLRGNAGYDLVSSNFHGRIEAGFNPRLLAPALAPNQAELVKSFACSGAPPAVEADFAGTAGSNAEIWVAGRVQATNFTYQSVPIELLESRIGLTNDVLSFDSIHLQRPEGKLIGCFKLDLKDNIAELDVTNSVDPTALARLAGPEIAAKLEGLRVGGPFHATAHGQIDIGASEHTDLRARIEGADLAYAPLEIDRCSMDVAVKQSRFDLSDIRAELYEGTLSGRASFYPVGTVTNFKYDVSARVNDVNLKMLLQSLGYKGNEEYEGLIYSEFAAAGFIGKDIGDTLSGNGWVRIQAGQLFQLRLFGGYSRMISILCPAGLGTVNMTDFSASFTVKDRKIETYDAKLSGPTLVVLGKGYYAFDETLDFIVWAKFPESKTLIPGLPKIPSPLLPKLLVVRLTGTVSDPKCWPLNLTKDQLLALPKDLVINMPKDVLAGLSKDLLSTLPKQLFINLPNKLLNALKFRPEQ